MARPLALAFSALFAAGAAHAEGIAVDDLGTLDFDTGVMTGGTYEAEATDPDRLTIFCADCDESVIVDVRLGKSKDGTEGRVRSGETTMEKMESLCKARDETCTIKGVIVGPAIGWVSVYSGSIAGSTTILLRDGDMLMIRSIAPATREQAAANGVLVRKALARQIVGTE